jgi:hypothetical protein
MASLFDYPGWGSTVTIARNPAPWIEGGPEGRQGEITFLVNGINNLAPFLAFCAGTVETLPIAGGGTIDRLVPLIHPDDPDMYLESYHADYMGRAMAELWAAGKSIHTEQFNRVLMRSMFRTLPAGVGSGLVFYTISTETGADVETIPGGAFKTITNRKLTGDRGITIPTTSLTVTTYLSPDPIGFAIHNIVGCVNSVPFVTDWGTYPEGTIRFDRIRDDRAVGTMGTQITKSFGMSFRREPWNKVLNDLGQWEYAVAVADGTTMKYSGADLNILKTA